MHFSLMQELCKKAYGLKIDTLLKSASFFKPPSRVEKYWTDI